MKTVLVIDDHYNDQQFMAALLGSCGHHVVQASDAIEALGTAREQPIDLIISNVLMHPIDGYEFLNQLRAEQGTNLPPVMFYVAACYEHEARAAAADYDVQYILTKPSSPQTIIAAVNAALPNQISTIPTGKTVKVDSHAPTPPIDPIDPAAVVFIVDDDPTFCRLLSELVAASGRKVEAYSTAEEFLDNYQNRPGCVLTDVELPGMNGFAMLETLRSRRIRIPAIVLTGHGDLPTAHLAMRLRVLDFLEKPASPRTLLSRIYYALQEDSIERSRHSQIEEIHLKMVTLTPRERELLDLLIEGKGSKQIAFDLNISVRTVAIHRAHLMAKTGACNVADLVRMGISDREVQPFIRYSH